jgi:hypothetical protein
MGPNQMIDMKENRIQQVGAQKLSGLPVDTTILFSDHKDIYKRRIEKRQRKLLAKLGVLAPFFGPSEKILQVAFGFSPASFVEQLLTGAFLHPLKRSLFVFTNRRILHIPTTRSLSYRFSISQIMYADCRQLRIRGSTLIAKYRSGRAEKFHCISRKDRRKVKALLKGVSLEGRTSPMLERTHLCPRCTKPLINNYYTCPNCSLKFKTKSWATALSIIFPGGGYFYTRHPFLGVSDAVMETIFTFLLIVISAAFLISSPHAPRSLSQAIVVCIIVLVFEKLATAMFSGKCVEEFIPKQRHVEVLLDQSPTHRSEPETEEMLCTGWRSR